MKKLLFVNACMRQEDSRTLALARECLGRLSARYEIDEIDLSEWKLAPIDAALYRQHQTVGYQPEAVETAKRVAAADRIVIAAPFWDMSFPSMLKVFFERMSLYGVTFCNLPDGNTVGNCRAERLLYITTRGMDIQTGDPLEQATPYVKAICFLWGIAAMETLAVSGTDVLTEKELSERFAAAREQSEKICEGF